MTPKRPNSTYHEPKACETCFKAKAKCVPAEDTETSACARCFRLEKPCTPRPAVKRKAAEISMIEESSSDDNASDSRLRNLEKRVDSLTSKLDHCDLPQSSLSRIKAPLSREAQLSSAHTDPLAQAQLDLYREHQARLFPFVSIPTGSVHQLREQCPLLLRAVVMASYWGDRGQQAQLGAALSRDLAHMAFVEGEKSFDMLQSLLVHIAFYHGHHRVHSQMSNLVQLAIALICDLGLDKPSHTNDRRKLIFDNSRTSYGFDSSSSDDGASGIERKRAVLGCFYLSSVSAVIFQRINALRFNQHLHALCRVLSSSNLASDTYGVRLVEYQALMEQITSSLRLDEAFEPGNPGALWQSQLDALHQSLSALERAVVGGADDVQLSNLAMHRYAALMYLHEVALFDKAWQPTARSQADRVSFARSCLTGAADFIWTFINLPNDALYTLPYSSWAQLGYALLIGSRLTLLQVPEWQQMDISKYLNYPSALDDVHRKLMQAADAHAPGQLSEEFDAFLTKAAGKVLRIKTWFLAYTKDTHNAEPAVEPATLAAASDFPIDWLTTDLNDDFWNEVTEGLGLPPPPLS